MGWRFPQRWDPTAPVSQRQGWGGEHEGVSVVLRAVVGQDIEVDHPAEDQAQVGERDLVR